MHVFVLTGVWESATEGAALFGSRLGDAVSVQLHTAHTGSHGYLESDLLFYQCLYQLLAQSSVSLATTLNVMSVILEAGKFHTIIKSEKSVIFVLDQWILNYCFQLSPKSQGIVFGPVIMVFKYNNWISILAIYTTSSDKINYEKI